MERRQVPHEPAALERAGRAIGQRTAEAYDTDALKEVRPVVERGD